MSKLVEFRAAERALQEQLAQLEALKNDAGLKKEIEFESKLKALMESYDKGLKEIIAILDPAAAGHRPALSEYAQRYHHLLPEVSPQLLQRMDYMLKPDAPRLPRVKPVWLDDRPCTLSPD